MGRHQRGGVEDSIRGNVRQAAYTASERAKSAFVQVQEYSKLHPSIWAMPQLTVWFPHDREPCPQSPPGVSGSLARRLLGNQPTPRDPSFTTRRVKAVPYYSGDAHRLSEHVFRELRPPSVKTHLRLTLFVVTLEFSFFVDRSAGTAGRLSKQMPAADCAARQGCIDSSIQGLG